MRLPSLRPFLYALPLFAIGPLFAQAPAPAAPVLLPALAAAPAQLLGIDNYIQTVVDLDKSFAFYRDVIGLEVKSAPSPWSSQERLQTLTHTRGAMFRSASFNMQGTGAGLLLTEFNGIDRHSVAPRNSDPGASTLVVTVRNLDKIFLAAKAAGVAVVTVGGQPLNLGPNSRSVFIKDLDGFFIEIAAPDTLPATAAPADSNIVTARIAFTVADSAKTLDFYHNVLGLEFRPAADFALSKTVAQLIDAPGAEFRAARAKIAGTNLDWEFPDFRAVPRTVYLGRLQDPGTPAVSVVVRDLDRSVKAMKAAGASVITTGGQPVLSTNGGKTIFVREPNGLIIEILQRP